MNPNMIAAMVYLCRDVIDLYEARRETHPSIPRDEQIELCVKAVLGRSEFDKRSVLDSDPDLTVPRAATLVALYKLGGSSGETTLGKLVDSLGIPKQTCYARLNALIARGYAEHDGVHRGFYRITDKGKATAVALTRD